MDVPHLPIKKALCVGISYKGQTGPYDSEPKDFELTGAHTDVAKVRELLTGYYDYDDKNITVLLDADGCKQPTRENILSAMEELVNGAKSGDAFFFFFAGHGDQIRNLDGSEPDELDEIILPLDWKFDASLPDDDRDKYSIKIIDDEMNNIMVKDLPTGCRLTALFDSCHSGTLLDLPYARSQGPRSQSPALERYMTTAPRTMSPEPTRTRAPLHSPRPQRETKVVYDNPDESTPPQVVDLQHGEVAHINRTVGRGPLELSYTLAQALVPRGRMGPYWRKGTWILRGESLDEKASPATGGAHVISWSACSDAQSGYEVQYVHENRSGGLMTQAFVEILKNKPSRTYRDILECLGHRLKKACEKMNEGKEEKERIMQEPQLGSQHKPDLDELFAP